MTSGGKALVLRTPTGGRYRFEPGALCLELPLTGGGGVRRGYERLHAPADLALWLAESPLAGGRLTAADVQVGEADLAAARELREAVWGAANSLASGRRPGGRDLAVLNRVATAAPPVPQVDPASGGRTWRTPVGGDSALSVLARDAIELVSGPLAGRVRRCAGPGCALVFVDTSRPGRRRWCSMERCGNREKLRALRERRQARHGAG